MIRWMLLSLAVGPLCMAQDAFFSRSLYEPPAAKAAASLAASTRSAPRDLLTTGEKSEWLETAPYAEAVELAHRLERASRFVKVLDFGTTGEGRTMIAIMVSKDRAFTPEAAAKTHKPVILIQNGIHSAEIEGKDTSLMLARDMTVSKRFAGWLDHAIFLIIPVFNIDGHEYPGPYHRLHQNGPKTAGLRATAQRLNLNRDYMKADTPEVRAWLRLFNAWLPDFMFDIHVSDGADFQYDVTNDMPQNQDVEAPVAAWVKKFFPEFDRRMTADGHLQALYGEFEPVPGGKPELFMAFGDRLFTPGLSHMYAGIQNRPGMLVELHSLKAPKTRAWTSYDLIRHSIETILVEPEALQRAVREADRDVASHAGDRSAAPVFLHGKISAQSHPFVYRGLKSEEFKSPITGAMVTRYLAQPEDIQTRFHDQIDTTVAAQMPLGYLIPAAWKPLADVLALHGVEMERTAKPLEQEFETYRFSGVKFAAAPNEGRVMMNFDAVTLGREKIAIPAGSYWVPMKQRRARVILSLLEPEAPESLARWGFCNTALEDTEVLAGEYVLEPMAQKMMADQPALRKQFEERLAADPQFAANPKARLLWWHHKSQFNEASVGLYPVVRVWEKNW